MMYGLLVPAGGGEPLPLLKTTLILGRRPECDVVISAKSVSGRHCQLDFIDGIWRVVDLDSHNGTGVDGRRCRKARIMPGQVLHVAKQRFHIDYPQPGQQPQEADDLALQLLQGSDPNADTLATVMQTPAEQATSSKPRHTGPPSSEPYSADSGDGPLGTLLPAGGGKPMPLPGDDLILGRSRRCDVRIHSSTVSSRHCRMQFISGYWVIEDLGSSNGIRVDGIRFHRKCVMPGAELSLSRESFILDYIPGEGVPPVIHEPLSGTRDTIRSQERGSLLEEAGLSSRDVEAIPEDENAIPNRRIYSLDDNEE